MRTEDFIQQWQAGLVRFNQGDSAGLYELLADDCVFDDWATSKSQIVAGIDAARADGWTSHETLSATAVGPFLVAIARNTFADGRTTLAAGISQFNEAGKIVSIRTSTVDS